MNNPELANTSHFAQVPSIEAPEIAYNNLQINTESDEVHEIPQRPKGIEIMASQEDFNMEVSPQVQGLKNSFNLSRQRNKKAPGRNNTNLKRGVKSSFTFHPLYKIDTTQDKKRGPLNRSLRHIKAISRHNLKPSDTNKLLAFSIYDPLNLKDAINSKIASRKADSIFSSPKDQKITQRDMLGNIELQQNSQRVPHLN